MQLNLILTFITAVVTEEASGAPEIFYIDFNVFIWFYLKNILNRLKRVHHQNSNYPTPSNSHVSLLKWSSDHLKILSKPNNQLTVPLIIWLEKLISHRQGKVKNPNDKAKNYDEKKRHILKGMTDTSDRHIQ